MRTAMVVALVMLAGCVGETTIYPPIDLGAATDADAGAAPDAADATDPLPIEDAATADAGQPDGQCGECPLNRRCDPVTGDTLHSVCLANGQCAEEVEIPCAEQDGTSVWICSACREIRGLP